MKVVFSLNLDAEKSEPILYDFVALDLEVADVGNTAPCAIGLAIVKSRKIVEKKYYLINPETEFNVYGIKIHGITPEMVKDAPTLPEIWEEISDILESRPVVIHNASYDMAVLKKATARYNLKFYKPEVFDTCRIARNNFQLEQYTLPFLCNNFGIEISEHHNALQDAVACAQMMLYFIDNSVKLSAPALDYNDITLSYNMYNILPSFERECLDIIKEILQPLKCPKELFRFKKSRSLDIHFYYRAVKIICVRKQYFVEVREKYMYLVDPALPYVALKNCNRFSLDTPTDLFNFKDYIIHMAEKSYIQWLEYVPTVQEKTLKKHIREHKKNTYNFMDLDRKCCDE